MTKRVLGAITLLIFISNLTACNIGRKAARNKTVADTAVITKPIDTATIAIAPVPVPVPATGNKKKLIDSVEPLWQKHFIYTSFVGKAKMHYEGGGTNEDFTANFRVKKDSVIWIAVTALGGMVQVARVYVTPDSFYLVNYIQKEAYRMPISQAAKLLPVPVDFATLQNLVVGEALRNSGKITDAADIAGVWSVQVEDNDYIQQVAYTKANSTLRSELLHTRGAGGVQASIQYTNYSLIAGWLFSMDRNINIQNAGNQYMLDMNFVNADFSQPLEFPFSIPRNYTIK